MDSYQHRQYGVLVNAHRRYRVRKYYQTGDIKEQRGLMHGKVHGPPPLTSVHIGPPGDHKQESAELLAMGFGSQPAGSSAGAMTGNATLYLMRLR
jgi:hypothetical protein